MRAYRLSNKRRSKKQSVIVLVLVLIVGLATMFLTACNQSDEAENKRSRGDEEKRTNENDAPENGTDSLGKSGSLKVGDIYQFGTYVQGGVVTESNYKDTIDAGTEKTPIEWIVLDQRDDKYLLLSLYGLDCQPYHVFDDDGTWDDYSGWEKSDLRAWLNKDFLGEAFSSQEQERIIKTSIRTPVSIDRNEVSDYATDTEDMVFLLGIHEVLYYYANGILSRNHRDCFITRYAKNNGAQVLKELYEGERGDKAEAVALWWTRTPRDNNETLVLYDNQFILDGKGCADMDETFIAVRPAIWVTVSP